MLGTAIRIAQRMKIHNESANAKCTALEAEMRRRLWWSLIIFDARISEKSGHKDVLLAPTWNCKTPLNVNDFDLRPEMKAPPAVHTESTEAFFAILRSELSDFTRYSSSYLEFTNPVLKSVAKEHAFLLGGDELIALEKTIEEKYFKLCNPENPLHFATIWTTRGYLAKSRLVEHYSRSSTQQTDTRGDVAIFHALRMLECDTNLLASPLTKSYLWWLMDLQFPFPAYLHIVQDLKRQPIGELVEKCWQVLSDNYKARFGSVDEKDNMFFKLFSRIILQAWAVREAVCRQSGEPEEPPWIISNIRYRVNWMTPDTQKSTIEQRDGSVGVNSNDLFIPMPLDFMGDGALHSFGGQVPIDQGFGGFPSMPAQATMGFDLNQLDWTATDWNPMYKHS